MASQLEDFTIRFFKNLKCKIFKKGEFLIIENVPKSFEDLSNKKSPYKITFSPKEKGIFIGRGSQMFNSMQKFLEGVGKTTLLKINFDVNPIKEIRSALIFKNCEIGEIETKFKNNFFSRFTFITTFKYMNESEQIVNEIYVHEGKIVKGNLEGYEVLEGDLPNSPTDTIKKDYEKAREELKNILENKTSKLGKILEEKLQEELSKINEHYDKLIGELGIDLNSQLEKIKEVEKMMETSSGEDSDKLISRLENLKKTLVKIGDDDSKEKILREKSFTIKDATHKHSLNIDNKLANTTIIYYPVFNFNLFLNKDSSKKNIKMTYDPLSKTINKLQCESCKSEISKINLCSLGHISCDECFSKCSECLKYFCEKCLRKNCSVCGRKLCKDCAVFCKSCNKYICKNHIRKDCVTGENRCVNCLRPCLRCHEMSQEKYFKIALDGSKVCQKCIGKERQEKIVERIFNN